LKGLGKVRAGAAIVAAGAILSCTTTAQAQRPANLGAGAPSGQSGIQLYDFSGYLGGSAAGEIVCPAPPAAPTPHCVAPPAPTTVNGRLERVFAYLQANGIKNVELYGYTSGLFPGTNPATPLNVEGLTALRALGDKYGLRFPGRHGDLTEANWDQQIAAGKILGQDHVGQAGLPSPGFNTYQNTLTTAQIMNRLGKRSVEAGLGPAYFHNHGAEFNTRYTDSGASCPTSSTAANCKSAFEIIMDRTDARYVSAQIDLGWAICGAAYGTPADPANGQAYVLAMVNKFTNRIVSFHVKDMVGITPNCNNNSQREIGTGDVNFGPIFAAAKNRVKYYMMERDPVGIGGPTNFNPFVNTANSLKAMKGDPAPVLQTAPTTFPSVAAGTAAAANQVPLKVINEGDAPLTITTAAIQANADDGGAATVADFQIISSNCYGTGNVGPLAPAKAAVLDNPDTADVNEAAPAVPAGTCTVNVGFKPTRTNYTSVARVQFTSNADDAMDRVLIVGQSTGDAITTVGGNVPTMLALNVPAQPGSFGTFLPTVAKSYETAMTANVTSTAGDAVLAVSDPSTSFPGHLVNGAFALPSPLNVRAINSTNPTQAFAPLAETTGAPTNLLTYTGPVNTDQITLGFRQAIGAGDVLRSGNYSKTLTFTLSTTAP
jgi:hypothetical protein